jgi:hypothetical protein
MTAIVGYRGRDAHERALARSSYANPNPRVVYLADGSAVGAGETIARGGDCERADVRLYGARGTSAWASEVQS